MNIRAAYTKYDKWRDGLPYPFAVILFGWEAFLAGTLILFPAAIAVIGFFALSMVATRYLFGV